MLRTHQSKPKPASRFNLFLTIVLGSLLILLLLTLSLVNASATPANGSNSLAQTTTQSSTFGWTTLGSMLSPRNWHTATLLDSGKVLVTGGYNGRTYLNSAELYDPATGTWNPTGNMATTRSFHTATLLPGGKILVTGGYYYDGTNSHYLSSAELYDPTSGIWNITGNMATPRENHTATLLPNGKVLVTGGSYFDGSSTRYLNSAELYDPATGTWSPAGVMQTGRQSHTATFLPNGKVLVVGGYFYDGADHYLASTEIFDPATGLWSAGGELTSSRENHTATLLSNGKVLVVGGFFPVNYNNFLPLSTEIYDPATNSWSLGGNIPAGRHLHSATLLQDGRVLITGGYGLVGNFGDVSTLDTAALYDPATGAWSTTGKMFGSRAYHPTILFPDGSVMVIGGKAGSESGRMLNDTEIYNPVTGTWNKNGRMISSRTRHTATPLTNGKVLVAGGYSNYNNQLNTAELFDPATRNWSLTGNMRQARYGNTATRLTNGKVLVAGGSTNNTVLNSAELYDPATGSWSITGSMSLARIGHTATLLSNGKVLVTGGTDYQTGAFNSAELYDPTTGIWSLTGNMTNIHFEHTATLLTDGKILVVGGSLSNKPAEIYNPDTGTWSLTGSMAVDRSSHNAILLAEGKVLVTGGDIGSGDFNTAELFDPATGTWSHTGAMAMSRRYASATLLSNGKVLVAGGYNRSNYQDNFLSTAELYDPTTGTWSATGNMATGRGYHTAILLADNSVLVTGGITNYETPVDSVEIYTPQEFPSPRPRPATPNPHLPHADLAGQLRVTPDRLASTNPTNEIKYTFSLKNLGQGKATNIKLTFPLNPNLSLGYFLPDEANTTWVSKVVTTGSQPYLQVSFTAPFEANQSTKNTTLVFRPSLTAQPGETIKLNYQLSWNDAAGNGQSTSNSVSFTLASIDQNLDETSGEVQLFNPHFLTITPGKTVSLTGDFYAPDEIVTFWYTGPDGKSTSLGNRWADEQGTIVIKTIIPDLVAGDYIIAGYGNRSAITGHLHLTVTG